MTFSRANPLGWNTNEVLTSSQANTIDLNISRAVDGYAGGVYSPSTTLEWREGVIIDATYSAQTNRTALDVTAKGTGYAVDATSGASATYVIRGIAHTSSNASGAYFEPRGTGKGAVIDATNSSGNGLNVTSADGDGVNVSTSGGRAGIFQVTGGTNPAVFGSNTSTGAGVHGFTTTGGGYAVIAEGKTSSPTRAALKIVPQSDTPSSLEDGATWIENKESYQRISGVTQKLNGPIAWITMVTNGTAGTNTLDVGHRYNIKESVGTHTGSDNQNGQTGEPLVDSGASWTTDELVGMKCENLTDGCIGRITANTSNTVTVASLTGGTENDWDNGDSYRIIWATPTTATTEARVYFSDDVVSYSSTARNAIGIVTVYDSNNDDVIGRVLFRTATPLDYFDVEVWDIGGAALVNLYSTAGQRMDVVIFGELD
jgi:hypothetical protein